MNRNPSSLSINDPEKSVNYVDLENTRLFTKSNRSCKKLCNSKINLFDEVSIRQSNNQMDLNCIIVTDLDRLRFLRTHCLRVAIRSPDSSRLRH